MKKLSIIVALAVSSQAWAGASGVTILSQQYHIWGSCADVNGRVYYDLSSSLPLSKTLTLTDYWPSAYGSPRSSAYSSASLFCVEAEGKGTEGPTGWPIYVACAAAEASWTFQPRTSMLEFTVNGGGAYFPGGGFLCSLVDLTENRTIVELSRGVDNCIYLQPYTDPQWLHYDDFDGPQFRFDPTHVYQLDLMVDIGGDLHDTSFCGITADIRQTPAPGAILLGALGTGLVGWMRRRGTV